MVATKLLKMYIVDQRFWGFLQRPSKCSNSPRQSIWWKLASLKQ